MHGEERILIWTDDLLVFPVLYNRVSKHHRQHLPGKGAVGGSWKSTGETTADALSEVDEAVMVSRGNTRIVQWPLTVAGCQTLGHPIYRLWCTVSAWVEQDALAFYATQALRPTRARSDCDQRALTAACGTEPQLVTISEPFKTRAATVKHR